MRANGSASLELHPRFLPQRVVAKGGLIPGDIHVDAVARYIYHIEEGGTAMRYGVAIARGRGLATSRRLYGANPAYHPTAALAQSTYTSSSLLFGSQALPS